MSAATSVPSITDAAFAGEVAQGIVAVDFTAEWCPPCRMMEPIVEQLARDCAATVRVFKMDTDANPATMVRLGMRGLPTMLVYRDGEIVDRIVGAVPPAVLRQRIEAVILGQRRSGASVAG
jgi:thioredoxin 1